MPCTLYFSGDAKLRRPKKLRASKNIIDRIYFIASIVSCKFVKLNPPSNFPVIWYSVINNLLLTVYQLS